MNFLNFKIEYSPIVRTCSVKDEDGQVCHIEYQRELHTVVNVKVKGNVITITLPNGIKGKAKCSPEDEFDLNKGVEIAMGRAYLKKLQKDIKKLVK